MAVNNEYGTLTFTPANVSGGAAGITVTLMDNGGTSNGGVNVSQQARFLTIVVVNVNVPPTISTIPNQSIPENGTAGPINFTVGDVETPVEQLTVAAVSANLTLVPPEGIELGGSGANRTITVTPAAGESGTTTITVVVSDGDGGATSTMFTVMVNAVNHPPVAFDQNVGVKENSSVSVRLTGDDGDPSVTQSLTYTITDYPDHGAVTNFNASTGTLTYTPVIGYYGPDSLEFTVTDDNSLQPGPLTSAAATVSITVAEDNQPPVLDVVDNKTITEGSTLVFRLTATDPDPDAALSYHLNWQGNWPWGVTFQSDTGLFLWAPEEWQGPAEHVVTVSVIDSSGSTSLEDSETIRISVVEQNLRPTITWNGWPLYAFPQSEAQILFGPESVDPYDLYLNPVDSYDNDNPAQGRTYSLIGGPGSIHPLTGEYHWLVPFNTPVSTIDVTIRVKDTWPTSKSHDVVVPISIGRSDETPIWAPVANADSYSVTHGRPYTSGVYELPNGTPVNGFTGGLLWNDTWGEGHGDLQHLPQILITQQPAHGTVTLTSHGHFTYAPLAGQTFAGLDTFRYKLTDRGRTHTGTVQMHITNEEPNAQDLSYNIKEGHPRTVSAANGILNGNTTDWEGDPTRVLSVVVGPAHADEEEGFEWNPDGSFTYTPAANYSGIDAIVYKIDETDAALLAYLEDSETWLRPDRSQYGIVRFYIAPNSPPTATDDTYPIAFGASGLTIPAASGVLVNDSDLDDAIEDLTAILVAGTSEGSVNLNNNGQGSFTFTPNGTFDGSATFSYKVSDGVDFSNVATVTVQYALHASNDNYSLVHNSRLAVLTSSVLDNDTNSNGDPLLAEISSLPSHGAILFQAGDLSFSPAGTFTYVPDPYFVGMDSFTYRAVDGTSMSNIATVYLNVTNLAPVAVADQSFTLGHDDILDVPSPGILANDTDADNGFVDEILGPVLVNDVSHGVLVFGDDGSFKYAPDPNYSGIDVFQYHVNDGIANSNVVSVWISVAPRSVADLDIQDAIYEAAWLPEREEALTGAYVAPSGHPTPALLLARQTAHLGYTRQITWDPYYINLLDDIGQPIPGGVLELPESIGDHTFQIMGTTAFTPETPQWISMAVFDELGNFVAQNPVRAAAAREFVQSMEFVNDHNLLRRAPGPADNPSYLRVGSRYYTPNAPTEYFVDAASRTPVRWNPISYTAGDNRYITIRLTLNVPGAVNGVPFRLEGTSGNEQSLSFDVQGNLQVAGGYTTITATATHAIGTEIREIAVSMQWKLTLNPQNDAGFAPTREITLPPTREQIMLITFGTPPDLPDPGTLDRLAPTLPRMRRSVAQFANAMNLLTEAEKVSQFPLVYLVRRVIAEQPFDLDNGKAERETGRVGAWEVPDALRRDNGRPGGDCISIVTYVSFMCTVTGLQGTYVPKTYIAEVTLKNDGVTVASVDADKALEGDPAIEGVDRPNRFKNGGRMMRLDDPTKQWFLGFADGSGSFNNFEAALKYTVDGQSYYIPAGVSGLEPIYNDPDKVITVMALLDYAPIINRVWTLVPDKPRIKTYQRALSDL